MAASSKWRASLRRLIGLAADEPNITVSITPDCVINPGDSVVIVIPRDVPPGTRERIAEAGSNWLPDGARLIVSTDERLTIINASKLIKQILRANCCDRSSDTRPQPLHSGEDAPEGASKPISDPAERAELCVNDATERVLNVVHPPKPSPHSLCNPHSGDPS